MPAAPETLRRQQLALAHWIRDPDASPPPPGIEPRRLRVYRELIRNTLDGLLTSQFPVIRGLRDEAFWCVLVDGFIREHRAQTPLFPEIGQEFVAWLHARAEAGRGDPAFLPELAHYEWAELGLALSDAVEEPSRIDAGGDLMQAVPVLSPQAWPLAYVWPVDRIRPDYQPEHPPLEPTLLLLQRTVDHTVKFARLDPLGYALLEQVRTAPAAGAVIVSRLADAWSMPAEPLMAPAQAMLAAMRERGVVLGARRG